MMTSRNEENLRTLAMLRYQADRYQSMRNGTDREMGIRR